MRADALSKGLDPRWQVRFGFAGGAFALLPLRQRFGDGVGHGLSGQPGEFAREPVGFFGLNAEGHDWARSRYAI